jgi:glycosyltransferase involved in cell wall biosynthesis
LIPRVLLVAGAYYPEISSAGLQCREVARALRDRVKFSVLVTAVDRSLPLVEDVAGVRVHRLPIVVDSAASRLMAGFRIAATFARVQRRVDLVHIHGFSTKNVPLTILARAFHTPIILTLHTADQDDPAAVKRRGRLAFWAFRQADLLTIVSPQLSQGSDANLAARTREIPNGVDTQRFTTATRDERLALRRRLGLPIEGTQILFVGFFSRDKRPGLLCDAWIRLAKRSAEPISLVCVGASNSTYFEVDPLLAEQMRRSACEAGLADRLILVEPTHAIHDYFRSADIFALPSAREALPMALLEAMACGLPCVAFRLAGATDVIVEDGVNALLVGNAAEFDGALERLLADRGCADALGGRARQTVVERYNIERTAECWLDAYRQILSVRSQRGD